jgi:hypothetical protein
MERMEGMEGLKEKIIWIPSYGYVWGAKYFNGQDMRI